MTQPKPIKAKSHKAFGALWDFMKLKFGGQKAI
jgi:hypothetical protein